MTYVLRGAINTEAAQALRRAGYTGMNAHLALIGFMSQIPREGNGTSPLCWKDGELWIPYVWTKDGIEIKLEEDGCNGKNHSSISEH